MTVARVAPALARLLASTLALCGLAACPAPEAPAPPASEVATDPAAEPAPGGLWDGSENAPLVVLVSLDTLRADHLGIYGYGRPTSPILDMFGSEGVVFEDASSTAPWTLPAHASLLTGMYPNRHRVVTVESILPFDTPTLAGTLRDAGFTTAAVVNSSWLVKDTYQITKDFDLYQWVPDTASRRSPQTWITDQAITWLSERSPDQPMFLFVHYYDLHSDYASLPAYEDLFVRPYDGPATGTADELNHANIEPVYRAWCDANFDQVDPGYCKWHHPSGGRPPQPPMVYDERDLAHLEDLYDASIRQLDTEVGRLLGYLRGEGLIDRALVFIVADHGEEFGEHGGTHHTRTQYQEVLRVPVMVRGPGVPAGMRIATPISLVDVAPTILAAVGIPPEKPFDGLDLRPLWSGGEVADFRDRPLFGETGYVHAEAYRINELKDRAPLTRAVRMGSFKLYYDKQATRPYVLYDLANDPGETTDVSAQHPELAAALTRLMEERYVPGTPAAPTRDLSPEDEERLRSLGYMQ